MSEFRDLAPILTGTLVSRRALLKRAAVLGVSAPVIGSLLAACGGDDEDDGDSTDDGETDASDEEDTGDTGGTDEETPENEDDEEPADEDGDATEESSGGEGEGQYGGEIVLLGHHEVESLSPDDRGPDVHWVMITNIHDSLVAVNEYYEITNELAADYQVSDDGLEYTFNLEEGVLFHDGEEFTAEDCVYNFEFHMNPDNATVLGTDYQSIESVEAPDDYTFVVRFADPDASFLRRAASYELVAAHHHSEIGEDEYKSNPIGTGPFMLEEYSPAAETRLAAFEDHWRGRPYADYLIERIVPEGSVRTLQLQNLEADGIVWPPIIDDNLALQDDEQITTFVTPAVSVNHFPLNNTHDVLSDRAIRRAMMYATDRQQVIDDVFLGAATLATANIAPSLEQWYNPDVTEYPYDPEMAVQTLEEAGWVEGDDGIREKDGLRASFTCLVITGDEQRLPEAETVQQYLGEVGIEMTIEEAPLATIQEGQRSGETDASLYNWTYGGSDGEPDGTNTLHSESRNNWNLWSNERVDELLAEGLAQTSEEDRVPIYHEVQAIVAEEVPMLYMMFWDWFVHFGPRIQGLPPVDDVLTGTNVFLRMRDFWVEEP